MTKRDHTSNQRTKYGSVFGVTVGIVLAGVILAASVSGAQSTTSTTKPSSASSHSGSTKASAGAFASCLKKHGVTGLGFGSGAVGRTRPAHGVTPPAGGFGGNSKVSAAFKACASLRPAGSGFGSASGPGGAGASSTAFAAFRNCMTLHGVKLPKKLSGAAALSNSSVTSNPKYKAAYAACSPLLPSPAKPRT